MKKNLYIGGYSILDLADANVYAQALICAKQNKPVLVYDDPLKYYADTIAIDTDNDDNVVITKGGKTITITDANSVSSEGEIQPSGSDKIKLLRVSLGESGQYLSVDILTKDTINYVVNDLGSLSESDVAFFQSLQNNRINSTSMIQSQAFVITIKSDKLYLYAFDEGAISDYNIDFEYPNAIVDFTGYELKFETIEY